MSEVTRILRAIESGESAAADELLPLVYNELRRLAAAKLTHEPGHQTLQPTALVHAAYVRLVDLADDKPRWNGRGHFFSAAAEAMRRILIERARKKKSLKRGGNRDRIDLDAAVVDASSDQLDLLALDEALRDLEERWPERAKLVKLRFFAGLTIPEAAQALEISRATAERRWAFTRTWLYSRLKNL